MKTLDYLKIYDNNNSNLIINYLEYIKLYKSKSTVNTYANSIKNFYDFLHIYYDIGLSSIVPIYYTAVLYIKVNRKCIEDYIAYQVNKNLIGDIIHCRIMAVKNYFKYLLKLKK